MLKLNLGSGSTRMDGFVNVDKFPDKNVDIVILINPINFII